MSRDGNIGLDGDRLRRISDGLPVAVTVTDPDGRILYYNAYSARLVDRRPEYIGRDIRACHRKPESIEKIDRIFREIKAGTLNEFYYETERNGKTLAVTVTPWKENGDLIGFVHSVVVKR